MDIRKLLERLSTNAASSSIFTIRQGQVVRCPFSQLAEDVGAAIAQLRAWNVRAGMRVGIRAKNCYQWIVYDLALIEVRAVSVAFTEDFASWELREICDRYGLGLLLTDGPRDDSLPYVASIFGAPEGVAARADAVATRDPDFERPALIFSSGSSGGLKGLVVNRAGAEACIETFAQALALRPNDRLLIFLPISNFQQRLMYYAALWYGFDLVLVEPQEFFRALQELQATILIAPPAVFENFENRFRNLPASSRMMTRVLGAAIACLPGRELRYSVGRRIFKRAHQAFGGRMRVMITGMAPIRSSTLRLFELLQMPLFETYGLIESGTVALNVPPSFRSGSVGRPVSGVTVRFGADREILVFRDKPMCQGYFQSAPGESESTFIDGGVATGDIGWMDNEGYLHLVGRKKETIVTSGGEKLHPEVLEAEVAECADVERIVILGTQGAHSLTAIIAPRLQDDRGAQERIRQAVSAVNERHRNARIGNVVFTDVKFTRENGLLRPNLKVDRRRIAEYFRAEAYAAHQIQV